MSASGRRLTLSQQGLLDRIRGGWTGRMVGVAYGAPTEFRYRQRLNADPRNWKAEELAGALGQDDLYVQMTFAGVMDRWGLEATTEGFGEAHRDSKYRLWHANLCARRLLLRGVSAPLTGHPDYNFPTNEIRTQFEADFIGLMCPGMARAAQRYSDRVGRVIAYGDGVSAGMYVSAMLAAALFERKPRAGRLLLRLQARQARLERRHGLLHLAQLLHPLREFAIVGLQFLRLLLQGADLFLLLPDLSILLQAQTVKRLNGGQGHTALIHCRDVLVVLAQAERRVEVLRHRPQVPD